MAEYLAFGIEDEENGNVYKFGDKTVRDKIEDGFVTNAGIGNLRVNPTTKKVQYNAGTEQTPNWKDTESGSAIRLPDVSGATAVVTTGTKAVSLTWSDPADIVVSGSPLATWAGTKVLRKADSAPTDIEDGTVVVDSKVRDAYSSTAFVDDSSLVYGITYYYRFFPYTDEDVVTDGSSVNAKPMDTGSITLSAYNATLNAGATSAVISVLDASGDVSVVSSDTNVATVSISNDEITIESVNNKSGNVTITVNVAASSTSEATSATISVVASFSKTMTIQLNFADSNPTTWATYADDAVGMTAGDSSWDDFFGVYECMLKDGVEGVKLNPNNLAKDIDGNNVNITDGSAGDVMTKFNKRLGWKVSKSNNVVSISLTDEDNKSGYCYKAFYYKGKKCKAFYRGCFKGFEQNSKLWSLSGKTITTSKTIGAFRTLAQAKGTGYEQSTYYAMQLLQLMYTLKYKGANAQIAIGRGYVDGNSAAAVTGGTIAKGRDWGETTGKQQMCFLNQEDFFGNIWEWLEGLTTDSGRNYMVCDPTTNTAFSDAGTGYIRVGGGWSSNQSGYISSVIGSNDAPFTADGFSGSETTYLCDYANVGASCVAIFGGRWNDASYAGAFHVDVNDAASDSNATIGSRLMFFEVEEEEENEEVENAA